MAAEKHHYNTLLAPHYSPLYDHLLSTGIIVCARRLLILPALLAKVLYPSAETLRNMAILLFVVLVITSVDFGISCRGRWMPK